MLYKKVHKVTAKRYSREKGLGKSPVTMLRTNYYQSLSLLSPAVRRSGVRPQRLSTVYSRRDPKDYNCRHRPVGTSHLAMD